MADITRKDVERRIKRGESLKEIDMTGLNLDDLNFGHPDLARSYQFPLATHHALYLSLIHI